MGNTYFDYIKTFLVLVVFIILSVGCIANMIIHRDEKKEKRIQEKEAERVAKAERKAARIARKEARKKKK